MIRGWKGITQKTKRGREEKEGRNKSIKRENERKVERNKKEINKRKKDFVFVSLRVSKYENKYIGKHQRWKKLAHACHTFAHLKVLELIANITGFRKPRGIHTAD
jgi:hypothetical protein